MKRIQIFLCLLFFAASSTAQVPVCAGNVVYVQNNNGTVSMQTIGSATPPVTILSNLPPSANGFAVGPSLGFPAPNPTFWTISGGTYWYYSGTTWVNTNHSCTNLVAVNIGGSGKRIYSLVGTTGQVYAYDGTGPALLVTTIPGFGGGGPYDIVGDDNDNFYLLQNMTPQSLSIYDPTGNFICSYAINGPVTIGGPGFAIVNNTVYYTNGQTPPPGNVVLGGFGGTIIPGNSTITYSAATFPNGSDWASCSLPVPSGTILAPDGSALDCNTASLLLTAQVLPGGIGMNPGPASSTLTSGSYLWTGPGIISGQNTASITVNQAGVYTFTVYSSGCPSQKVTKSFTVTGWSPALPPTITPPTCLYSGNMQLVPSQNAANNTFTWTGTGILGANTSSAVTVIASGKYSVTITNTLLNCAVTLTTQVLPLPLVGLSLSSSSMCAQGFNNSPTTITLSPVGATAYTLVTSSNLVASPSLPWVCTPAGPPQNNVAFASATILGTNGTCSNSATYNFTIFPNPVAGITPSLSTICEGRSQTFTASGAAGYAWFANGNILTTTSNSIVVNPSVTTIYSLTASSLGCNSLPQTSLLNVIQIPSISVTSSPTICGGSSVFLSVAGTANQFTWSPSIGLSGTNGAMVVANPTVTQNYTVTGSNSCTNIAVTRVSVISPPVVSIAASAKSVCTQGFVNLEAFGASSFSWGPTTEINSAFGRSIIAHPSSHTTFTVWGFDGTCTGTASILVNTIQYPNIQLFAVEKVVCTGGSLTVNAIGADTYSWFPSAVYSSPTGANSIVSPTASTTYTVYGSNNSGTLSCPQSILYPVSVMPIALAKVSASVAICKGNKAGLRASGGNHYQWIPRAGLSASDLANITASPNVSTIYSVHVSYNGYCGTTNTVFVRVNANPTVDAGTDTTFNSDELMTLRASGNGTLSWINGEGIACKDCPETIITPQTSNCYVVEALNVAGCKAQDVVCVTVTDYYNIYIPDSFTPDDNGLNDTFIIYGTGISDITMDIYNRWGQLMFNSKSQLTGWDGKFKGVGCDDGLYVYSIKFRSIDNKLHYKTGQVNLMR